MLRLLEHPVSSYAQKVKIALREKRLPFTAVTPVDFSREQPDGVLAQATPRAEIPVLVDGDTTIFESTIILEYLEERWPDPPLLPPGAAARARARITEDVCDTQYEAVNWGVAEIAWYGRADGALAEQLRAAAVRHTATLQAWLADRLGDAPWFGGASFGWADAAAAPVVNRSVVCGLGPAEGSPLAAWHGRLRERPSVRETFDEFDRGLAALRAAPSPYVPGGRRREYRDHRLEWMLRSGGAAVVTEGLRANTIRFGWPS